MARLIRRLKREAMVAAVVTAALSVLASSAASAQTPIPNQPSAENGRALAQRLCSNCHIVETGSTKVVPAGVPTFRAIAQRPGQTGARIRDMLIAPPHQMPDMSLTRAEIDDILAYLNELRADPSQAPLQPDPGAPKPAFPKAS